MMEDALTQLRKVVVEIGGKRSELVLRVPPTGAELPLLPSPNAPPTEAHRIDRLSLIIVGSSNRSTASRSRRSERSHSLPTPQVPQRCSACAPSSTTTSAMAASFT